MLRAFLFVGIFLMCPGSRAEYRAFLLRISKPPSTAPTEANKAAATQDFRLVKTNFDEEQYPSYYPLAPGETISELETWMCRGRTGGLQEVCENPNKPRDPASTEPTPTK